MHRLTPAPLQGYDVLGFLIADKCNFTCAHCCNESHPHGETLLDTATICRTIGEAQQAGGFREVGISGGEPFLFPKQLAAITQHAAACGFSVAVTSNGFWATSPEAAARALGPLHADGLRCLTLSVSQFHLRFTTPEKLCTAVRAALDLGMVTRVNVVRTTTFGEADVRRLLGDLAGRAEFVSIPCIPTGRATDLVFMDELPLSPGVPTGSCAQHFTKLAVTAAGEAFPCCSPGGFTAPLKVGDVTRQPVGEILAGMARNPLLQVLHHVGPAFFAPFIVRALGREALRDAYVDQCHLCHSIMSDARLYAVVESILDALTQELAALHIDITALADLAPMAS